MDIIEENDSRHLTCRGCEINLVFIDLNFKDGV